MEPFVTSVKVDTKGGHDTVWVFVEGKCVGQLVCGLGHGERLQNILLSEKYFGTGRTPDAPITEHEFVAWRVMATNWLDQYEVHTSDRGAVGRVVLRLLDRVQQLEDEHERPTDRVKRPSLIDMILEKKQALFIEDVPWFVKDFHVLYKAARNLSDRITGSHAFDPEQAAGVGDALRNLHAQLDRLAPAYKETEAVRATAVQRGSR